MTLREKVIEKINNVCLSKDISFLEKELSEQKNLPLAVILAVAETQIKLNRADCSNLLILEAKKRCFEHPLLDEFEAKLLWSTGKRREALAVAIRAEEIWKRSYLVDLISAMRQQLTDTDFN